MTKGITIEVEMQAFMNGTIRPVDIPVEHINEFIAAEEATKLEMVFHFGQNDFQPKQFTSVSVGDVVRLYGKRFKVAGTGFEEVQ